MRGSASLTMSSLFRAARRRRWSFGSSLTSSRASAPNVRRHASLSTGNARFLTAELMRGTSGVSRASAFACNLPHPISVHRGKSATSRPWWLGCALVGLFFLGVGSSVARCGTGRGHIARVFERMINGRHVPSPTATLKARCRMNETTWPFTEATDVPATGAVLPRQHVLDRGTPSISRGELSPRGPSMAFASKARC
jgi:hypothetical protein